MPNFGTIPNNLSIGTGESIYFDGTNFAAYTPSVGGSGITSLNTLVGST